MLKQEIAVQLNRSVPGVEKANSRFKTCSAARSFVSLHVGSQGRVVPCSLYGS